MDQYYKHGQQIKNYKIIKLLGEGRFGIVYLIEDNNSKKYILKQLKNEMLEQNKNKLFYEEKLLSKFNNSKFPKFIGNFTDKNIQGYILEYIEGKVFEDLLYEGYEFSRLEIYTIAEQLLDIIEILHQNNIVHRDIRMPNVILKSTNELVLIDFGLARYMDNKKNANQIDYWFFGDFLIHLYYTIFNSEPPKEGIPWFKELTLSPIERHFLKKLMGIEGKYKNINQIRKDLNIIKNTTK